LQHDGKTLCKMPFKTTQQQVPLSLGSTLSWLFTLDLSCPLDFR
jgi:hypothetical protein